MAKTEEQIRIEVIKGNVNALYKNKIWLSKRKEILKRDNYECQVCKRNFKKPKRATVVHHVIELREDPYLMLCDDNLESVCVKCHNKLHPEKLLKYKNKKFTNKERY